MHLQERQRKNETEYKDKLPKNGGSKLRKDEEKPSGEKWVSEEWIEIEWSIHPSYSAASVRHK